MGVRLYGGLQDSLNPPTRLQILYPRFELRRGDGSRRSGPTGGQYLHPCGIPTTRLCRRGPNQGSPRRVGLVPGTLTSQALTAVARSRGAVRGVIARCSDRSSGPYTDPSSLKWIRSLLTDNYVCNYVTVC